MEEAYGRRIHQRPPRPEWVNSPPEYYTAPVMDPFGMAAGGYMGPGMVGHGNMGPPILPGAFQTQSTFNLPPPGPAANSNLTFRPSPIIGARGPLMAHQASQINVYGNHHGSVHRIFSPPQG